MIEPARTWDADVPGGSMRVVEWGPQRDPSGAGVLAIHGITANHRSWEPLAQHLPGRRLIAVDLRGRGRSAELPGPYGIGTHAEDLAAVLTQADETRTLVVGHSMGASVALALNLLAPQRVAGLVLVDGGLPLSGLAGSTPEEIAALLLGPALARLSMTFPDVESYRAFWRQHPAFVDDWSEAVQRYVDYDLVGSPGAHHSCVRQAAVQGDFLDQLSGAVPQAAVASLPGIDFRFLRAPRGLLNEPPGLYSSDDMARFEVAYGGMHWQDVPDVNHYTILTTDRGAEAVATAIVAA